MDGTCERGEKREGGRERERQRSQVAGETQVIIHERGQKRNLILRLGTLVPFE